MIKVSIAVSTVGREPAITVLSPFHAGDVIGLVLAWFSLLPVFILIGFVALIMFHRDLHTVSPSEAAGVE
jgi:hypothetical protein